VFASSTQRRRFEREVEIVAGLRHPNIVTVFDSGLTEDGSHFFAMEYVEGASLDDWLLAGGAQSPLRERLHIFRAICDGVAFAHQRGVIHRDLKPQNIMIAADGTPRLVDFGLARPVPDSIIDGRSDVTVEGSFLGTLRYAAPEQTRGDPNLVDVRSDVYALGVLLYEMLAGHSPYDLAGDPASMIETIRDVTPLPPSAHGRRVPGAIRIDRDLDTITLTALAKERDRRYQSASALRDDLDRYLAREPIEARRDSAWYVLRKLVQRYRWRASIAAGFLVVLIASSVVVSFLYHRARTEAEKFRQINLFLEDTLGSAQPAAGGGDLALRDLLDEAVQWIDLALADKPEVAASIRVTIGNSYRNLGLFDDAETQLEAALETRRSLFGERHAQIAQSLNVLGMLRRDQGRYAEADQLLRRALAMRRRLLGDQSYEVSLTLAILASVRIAAGDCDGAEGALQESLAIREHLFGPVHQDVAMCHFSLGEVAVACGDLEAAASHHLLALKIRREVLPKQHPDLARSLEATARVLSGLGRAEESESLLRECVAIQSAAGRPEQWRIALTRNELGACLIELGRYDEAETELLESYRDLVRTLGARDPRTRTAIQRIIRLYERWNRPDQASSWRDRLPRPADESSTSAVRSG
jgi:tetratricopeptide (TPR) repeat protein